MTQTSHPSQTRVLFYPPFTTRHPRPLAPLSIADGFGAEGRAPDVPPNATLEIEMTLLSWKKVEKASHTTQFVYPILLSLQPGRDGNRPAELEEGGKGEGCDASCLFVVARAYSVAPKATLEIVPHVISCALRCCGAGSHSSWLPCSDLHAVRAAAGAGYRRAGHEEGTAGEQGVEDARPRWVGVRHL